MFSSKWNASALFRRALTALVLTSVWMGGLAAVSFADEDSSDIGALMGGDHAYVIGPQNLIQIKIFGEAGLNQVYRVDESGYITHPLVGRVMVAGVSVAQAEKNLEKMLAGDYILDPKVTVFVIEHSRYSIMGEVRRPGTYEIMGRVSILEAISTAGGFTEVANPREIKVLRKQDDEETTLKVDTTLLQKGATDRFDVEADDVIVVSKSFF